jgi:putative Holliday junction resolvase
LILLAIDPGAARHGVAYNQGELVLAIDAVSAGPEAIRILSEIAVAKRADGVVVGLPLSLSGDHTASTKLALALANELETSLAVPVRLVDERLSTAGAARRLGTAGKSSKEQKSFIDSEAAREILTSALRIGFESCLELSDA